MASTSSSRSARSARRSRSTTAGCARAARSGRPSGTPDVAGRSASASISAANAGRPRRRSSPSPCCGASRDESRRSSRPRRSSTRATGCGRSRGSRAASATAGEHRRPLRVDPGGRAHARWDISWYQYRINRDAPQRVRLAERGLEPGELEDEVHGMERPFRARDRGYPGTRSRAVASDRSPYNEMWGG